MKIKRLTILNIASIADAVIDFTAEPLSSAPLFLITGQTGAGKSTLIDSICLALYGQTPRMARSRSRESYQVERTDGDTDNISINDNRQLMRRGTGECFAELLFEGNDERNYLARWQLRRAYNKPTGNMGKEEHTYTDVATEALIAKNRAVDDDLVQRLIGLTYSQFCRTSLLAQGEFTRFLQASSDEKSEILEKLTGTEIYSQLGRQIYAQAKDCENKYQTQRAAIETIALLGNEEVETLNTQIAEGKAKGGQLAQQMACNELQLNWLTNHNRLQKSLAEANSKIAELDVWLKSDDYRAKLATITDYEASPEARVRLADLQKAQKEVAQLNAKLPKAEQLVKEYNARCNALAERQQALQKEIDGQSKLLAQLNTEQLNSQRKALIARQQALTLLGATINKAADNKNEQTSTRLALDECLKTLKAIDLEQAATLPRLTEAEAEALKCRDRYNRMSLSTAQAAKELRAALTVGDTCPVCGSKVDRILTQEYFKSQLQPLKDELDKADELMRNLKQRKTELEAAATVNSREAERLQTKLDNLAREEQTLSQTIEAQAQQAQTAAQAEVVKLELDKVANELEINTTAQNTVSNTANKLSQLYDLMNKSRTEGDQLREAANKAANDVATIKNQTATHNATIAQNGLYLSTFAQQHPGLDTGRLDYLNSLKTSDVQKVKQYCHDKQAELQQLAGSKQQIMKQLADSEQSRPTLPDGVSEEQLAKTRTELAASQQTLLKEVAGAESRLEADQNQRRRRQSLEQQLNNLRSQWLEWGELAKHFGDSEGKKFRNIAQSFILSHILGIANHYLSGFSDRYTLTCNPGSLVILVADRQLGGTPQGINILSGGESFMVSLSLALALAHINSSQVNVDTLFIDEGFGTLSDDYLACVIDTLEKLRQSGGRRVGIISHVEELGERIPTQIKVERVSPSTSRITVANR